MESLRPIQASEPLVRRTIVRVFVAVMVLSVAADLICWRLSEVSANAEFDTCMYVFLPIRAAIILFASRHLGSLNRLGLWTVAMLGGGLWIADGFVGSIIQFVIAYDFVSELPGELTTDLAEMTFRFRLILLPLAMLLGAIGALWGRANNSK